MGDNRKGSSTIGVPAKKKARAAAISTPLPEEAKKNQNGNYSIKIGDVEVDFLLDTTTKYQFEDGITSSDTTQSDLKAPHYALDARGLIKSFDKLPPVVISIYTVYRKGAKKLSDSKYGRGTTFWDRLFMTTSLQFHEGTHGSAIVDFLTRNPHPVFGGEVGMKEKEFKKEWVKYVKEIESYYKEMQLRQQRDIECVGKPSKETFADGTTCSTLATPNPKYK